MDANKVVLALLLMFTGISSMANSYFFFGQFPLIMVSDSGNFSNFRLGDDDLVIDQKISKKLKRLWSYSDSKHPHPVTGRIAKRYLGCDESLVIEASDGSRGLLATKRMRVFPTTLSEGLTNALDSQGRQLLAMSLQTHKFDSQWSEQLIKRAKVTPIDISHGKESSLVVTVSNETGGKSMMALLIAIPDDRSGYVFSFEEVKIGEASDGEGYAGTAELAMHVDLDGDGVEELILKRTGYESFDFDLLRWDGHQWLGISGGGGGC